MFGSSFGQTKPAGGGLFGASLNTNNTSQTGGGLFGGLGQNNQQNQQQPSGGLFGGSGQNNQQSQPQQSGLVGGLGQSTQNPSQQNGGLFGGLGQQNQQTQQNQPTGGLFGGLGQSTQNPQQSGGVFGGFGQSQQTQNQQSTGLFGGLGQNSQQQQNVNPFQSSQPQPRLGQGSAIWQPNSGFSPREKTIPEQMATVLQKWDVNSPDCAFKHYFYNKVDDTMVPFYRPAPNEDPKAWEEALSKKPGPGFIPVLCTGFAQMGERITLQQRNLANFNARLHEINNCLSELMRNHETQTSIRAADAKRKHIVLKQRCLALATKVQILRNRGYAMGPDEEDVRTKLIALERGASDPGLSARSEEIWARMITVTERARQLREEIEKSGAETPDMLDEEMTRRAKKILEDYNTQLLHLKTEIEAIHKDFAVWEKDQPVAAKPKETKKNDTPRRSQFA